MKKALLFLTAGIASFLVQNASAQSVLANSWENSVEGWGSVEPTLWTSSGFSTTTGVTQGTYSWILTASGGPDYGTAIGGTASTTLTAELANASSVSVNVLATGFSYMQWSLALNGGGLGFTSVDGYSYSQSPTIGTESTLTWTISSALRTTLAANLTTPTSLNFLIGGGNPGTIYMDNLTITELAVPEPTTLAIAGLGAVGLLAVRRRKA
jgi:hypothetical protein